MRYITNPDEIKRIINKIIETNGGIFRLKPTWIARGGSSTQIGRASCRERV